MRAATWAAICALLITDPGADGARAVGYSERSVRAMMEVA